jgi:taurine transport system permease protein
MSTETSLAIGVTSAPAVPTRRSGAYRKAFWPFVATVGTVLALLILWQVSATAGWVSPVFLPPPLKVLQAAGTLITKGYVDATIVQHALASLGRVFSALFFSALVAVPVGILVATSPVGRGILDPLIEFIRPLPPLAYLPLIIIWFGIGEPSKVLVIALAMVAPIAISTAAGIRAVSETQVNAARAFGASRLDVVRHVLIPSALPSILTGLRIALGAGWSTLVAAELVAASRGLGFMIQSAAQFLVTDVVIVGILVISGLAFAFEAVLRLIERLFIPWSGRQ